MGYLFPVLFKDWTNHYLDFVFCLLSHVLTNSPTWLSTPCQNQFLMHPDVPAILSISSPWDVLSSSFTRLGSWPHASCMNVALPLSCLHPGGLSCLSPTSIPCFLDPQSARCLVPSSVRWRKLSSGFLRQVVWKVNFWEIAWLKTSSFRTHTCLRAEPRIISQVGDRCSWEFGSHAPLSPNLQGSYSVQSCPAPWSCGWSLYFSLRSWKNFLCPKYSQI